MFKFGKANKELFGPTPRFVGLVGKEMGDNVSQFMVFDDITYELFLEKNYGERNIYTRVSHISDSGKSVVDKVFLDLDVDKEEKGVEQTPEEQLFDEMRDDRMRADEVLGDVVDDARRAAHYIDEELGWPAIGVYSGMGIHIHILTKSKVTPTMELKTTAKMIEDEANLRTLDNKGTRQGDYNRLCRVVNCPRVSKSGNQVGVNTIPLTIEELKELETDKLLQKAESTRTVDFPTGNKPELQEWEDYKTTTEDDLDDVEVKNVGELAPNEIDKEVEKLLKDALRMPCMYERIMSRNPDHDVRFNCAVLLFNCGLRPEDVADIYSKLGWFDFDRDVTLRHLESIWDGPWTSLSCHTIQERGLCVWDTVKERKEKCQTYGWEGGDALW